MLFRPFYGVMYGCVIRKVCVGYIYIRAYIIISTCVRAKEMAAFVSHFRHLYVVASLSLYCAIATFVSVLLLCRCRTMATLRSSIITSGKYYHSFHVRFSSFHLLLLNEPQSELVALALECLYSCIKFLSL